MDRKGIAREIAQDLLDNNALDENNFNYDTDAILEYVQGVVLAHLRDFMIIHGSLIG